MVTLKPQSNGHSNTMIGTLSVDGLAVTFGTARRGLGGATHIHSSYMAMFVDWGQRLIAYGV